MYRKKFLSLILAVTMIFGVISPLSVLGSATKTELTLSVNKTAYIPGEEVSVTLGFKDLAKSSTAGLLGFTLALQYNANLFDISPYSSFSAPDNTNVYNTNGYTKGALLSNASNYDFSAPVDIDMGGGIHEIRFLVLDNTSGSSPTPYADFEVATVKFQVKAAAALGATTFSYRHAYTSMLDSETFDMVNTTNVQVNNAAFSIIAANTSNAITSFSFNGALSTGINPTIGAIDVKVPYGTTLTNLVAKFVASPFATVKVGATNQVSGTTPNNFSTPVTYAVTSQGGVTKNYSVTVTVDINRAPLNTAITTATSTASAAVIGTAIGNYIQENLDNLNTAIYNARAVVVNGKATQVQADDATANLNNAVTIFKSTAVVAANKQVLAQTITDALTLWANTLTGAGLGQATLANKNTFKTAIDAAAVVRDNGSATQPQIDSAVTTLNTAVNTFKATFTAGPNKASLLTKINSASIMRDNAVVGKANGQYPHTAVTNLAAAITTATTTYNDVNATQTAVNTAVNNLDTAIITFLATKFSINDGPLHNAIVDAQNFINTAVVGTAYGNYPQSTIDTLNTAITAAISTYNNGAATQPVIDGATTTLRNAINTALGTVVQTTGTTALEAAIAYAQSLVATATIGTTAGTYLQASKDTLNAAITAAQTVQSNGASTQPQINTATITLNTAILNFKPIAQTLANKTALNTAITAARTVLNAAVVGGLSGQYLQGHKDSLSLAYSSAQSVLADDTALQGTVDSTTATLNNMVANMQAKILRSAISAVGAFKLDHTGLRLTNISPDSTLTQIQAGLSASLDGTISYFKSDGITPISGGTTKIGTGVVVKLSDNVGSTSYKVVVYGDISGDGTINLVDLLMLRKHLLSTTLLTGVQLEAADAKRAGTAVSPSDMVYLKGYILGTRTITQN